MCDFVSTWRKGVISSMSVLEIGVLCLHKDNNFLNGMKNIIIYKTIMKKINEMRLRMPYLNVFVKFEASTKLELEFLSKTRLESEFVHDNWILLIKSAKTFVCSIAFLS